MNLSGILVVIWLIFHFVFDGVLPCWAWNFDKGNEGGDPCVDDGGGGG